MTLDAGWAGVLGALIGIFGTLAATWLSHWLQNRRTLSLDEKRRAELLRRLSGPKYAWRSIEHLSAAIGASETVTAELLLEIGARASLTNNKSWALESRKPFPADEQPPN